MTKRAVVNASPLIQLAKIERLNLLNDFFGVVRIPHAVLLEIKDLDISTLSYEMLKVNDSNAAIRLLHPLHIGEAEVIISAIECNADFAILDDMGARNKAVQLGLGVIGTLGILQRANKHGLISNLKRDILCLRSSGMYMSDKLVQKILLQ